MNWINKMDKKTQEILKKFVEESSKELNLKGIVQFGSSTYSKNPRDIDLLFFSREDIFPYGDIIKLIEIIKLFENKYNVTFDFSGSDRKRKKGISITIVIFGLKELEVTYNPHDLIFFMDVIKDKNKKILYGENPLKRLRVKITNKHLFEALNVDRKRALRKCLDDENYRLDSFYDLFKGILRYMLINENVSKKDELLNAFNKKYEKWIKLPKYSERIISHSLKKEDFNEILKFSNNCINYLSENL